MFIYTTKLTKAKLITFVIAVGVLIGAIIMFWPEETAYDALNEQFLQAEETSITVLGIETNEDRIIFLNERGLDVSESEIDKKTVQIPSEFDEVFQKYNTLQLQSGFNLEKFKGKTVEMYTYRVLNFTQDPDEVHANILIYKNKIIGGDVSSVNLDGFITGFDKID